MPQTARNRGDHDRRSYRVSDEMCAHEKGGPPRVPPSPYEWLSRTHAYRLDAQPCAALDPNAGPAPRDREVSTTPASPTAPMTTGAGSGIIATSVP